MNIIRSGLDRSNLSNNLSHSILNSSNMKVGLTSINAGAANHVSA